MNQNLRHTAYGRFLKQGNPMAFFTERPKWRYEYVRNDKIIFQTDDPEKAFNWAIRRGLEPLDSTFQVVGKKYLEARGVS